MKIKFIIIPKLSVLLRLIIFICLVCLGFLLQFSRSFGIYIFDGSNFFLGTGIMIISVFFIAAKNYNNKPVDLGFEDWKPVSDKEFNKINSNLEMTQSAKYPFYFKPAMGIVLYVILGVLAFFFLMIEVFIHFVILLDIAILFFPIFFTGAINLWTPGELTMKMQRFNSVLSNRMDSSQNIKITPYIRFDKDKEGRQIPEDIRFMVESKRKPEDFMGVQLQIAINKGPNGAVPYMYAVFLCKGKGASYSKIGKMDFSNMIKTAGGDNKYGHIVIRQNTGGGGYHTTNNQCVRLYELILAKIKELMA